MQNRRHILRRLLIVLSVTALPACSESFGAGGCDLTVTYRLDPTSTSIEVGESFTASARTVSCGDDSDEFTWQSVDPTIASVESSTGRVTGRSPGATDIRAILQGPEHAVGAVRVMVR